MPSHHDSVLWQRHVFCKHAIRRGGHVLADLEPRARGADGHDRADALKPDIEWRARILEVLAGSELFTSENKKINSVGVSIFARRGMFSAYIHVRSIDSNMLDGNQHIVLGRRDKRNGNDRGGLSKIRGERVTRQLLKGRGQCLWRGGRRHGAKTSAPGPATPGPARGRRWCSAALSTYRDEQTRPPVVPSRMAASASRMQWRWISGSRAQQELLSHGSILLA